MIVVTGANGFVGKRLVEKLVTENKQVRAIDLRFSENFSDSRLIHRLVCDIRDAKAISAAIEPGDTVVHLAARVASPSISENQSINVEGTVNVSKACDKSSARLIFMSAAAAKFASANAYGLSKRQAEEIVSGLKIEKIILRTPLILGKGGEEYERFVEYVAKIPGLVPVFGSGSALKQPVHIDDVTQALSILVSDTAWKMDVLEFACREKVTFNDLIDLECKAAGLKKWKLKIPTSISLLMASIAENLLGEKSPITRDIINGINEPVNFDVEPTLAYLGLAPISPEDAFIKAKAQS